METYFIDANIFLRFLTRDNIEKQRRAENIFKRAISGEILLITTDLVIAEVVWTLESFYNVSKEMICDMIEGILNTHNLKIRDAKILREAISIYKERNIDFVDAHSIVYMREKSINKIYSFNKKHLDKFSDIKRFED